MSSIVEFEDRNIDIVAKMVKTTRLLDKMISTEVLTYGVTKAQIDVLFILHFSNSDKIKASEVAKELLVSKANIAGIVARLEDAQLITRTKSTEDSRVQFLRVTEKGNGLIDAIIPKYFRMCENAMSSFTTENKTVLLNQLKMIEEFIESKNI